MKIGFSSAAAPSWDLERLVTQAAELGFEGLELRGLGGELHLPSVPALARDPQSVRSFLKDKAIELVCLASSATLSPRRERELTRHRAAIVEFIELAGELGCPCVRIHAGEVEKGDDRAAALARVAQELRSLVPSAVRYGVTLLIENGGDFCGSADMWYVMDAVNHPSVRCCWNQCHAMTLNERPTTSLPRLGRKIGMVHLCDAKFGPGGVLSGYAPLGEGDTEVERGIELLRGLIYQGYLIFEWPKLWVPSLPDPQNALPGVAAFLKEVLAKKQPVLSAYKGDNNAPKLPANVGG
jgi:fatty-acyl-CoA synthase